MLLDEKTIIDRKECPFCETAMIRPREGAWGNKREPFITFSCSQFKGDEKHEYEHCLSYNDWECPQCGIFLFYRA
jgi:ribosomal protein S27AE